MGDTESCSSRVFSSGWNQNRKQRQKIEVYNEVLSRLRELNFPDAVVPGFEDELWAHFYCLPTRYPEEPSCYSHHFFNLSCSIFPSQENWKEKQEKERKKRTE